MPRWQLREFSASSGEKFCGRAALLIRRRGRPGVCRVRCGSYGLFKSMASLGSSPRIWRFVGWCLIGAHAPALVSASSPNRQNPVGTSSQPKEGHFPGGHSLDELQAMWGTHCGLNAAYMLLRHHNRAAEYSELRDIIQIGPRGSSLRSLRDALRRFGCDAHAWNCDHESLRQLPLPFIVHVTQSARSYDDRDLGVQAHYFVVTCWDRSGLWVIDATSAEQRHITFPRFREIFTGYVLTVNRGDRWWNTSFLVPSLLNMMAWLGVAILAILKCSRQVRTVRSEPVCLKRPTAARSRHVAFRICIGTVLISAPARAEPATGPALDANWRNASHDAENCLYLLLRRHHRRAGYNRIVAALGASGGRHSLLELKRVAESQGLSASVCRLSPGSLSAANLPAIVHLERGGVEQGEFVLLLGWDANEIVFVPGAWVTIERLRRDDFCRAWTGYALVADECSGRSPIVLAACLGGGTVIGVGGIISILCQRRYLKRKNADT